MDALLSLIPGGSLTAIGAVILAVLAGLWKFGASKKSEGRNEVIVEQRQKDDKLQKEFDKIDNTRPDLDESIGRLRNRSTKP